MEIVFTNHAIYRLRKRKILEQEVIEAIKCPDVTIKRYGLYYFRKNLSRGIIEVSCEKTEKIIKIVTVYWL